MSLLANDQNIWISAGVTRQPSPMVATNAPPNGVFIYAPTSSWAGYFYMNGYSYSEIDVDTQSRDVTEILLLQTQNGASTIVFNYTGASRSGVSIDPEIDFEDGNFVMWAHGGL